MTAKHTPGPWELLRGGIEVQSETNNHEIHAFVVGIPVPIAEVHRNMHVEHDDPVGEYVMSKAEGLANAALLTAAPDLLAALEDACNVMAAIVTGDLDGLSPNSPALIEARAAIAKAKGE
jgi:hypothetical protein